MGIGINATNNINLNQNKSAEQPLEEKIGDYLKDSGRTIKNESNFKSAISQLQSKKMTVQNFCKEILNSNNSNDLQSITEILEQTVPSEQQEAAIKNTNTQEQQSTINSGKPAISENPNTLNQLSIVQTSASDQLLASEVASFVKKGNVKEALTKTNGNGELADKALGSLQKAASSNQQQLQSMIAFANGAINDFAGLNPSVLESLKEKLDKMKKELEEIDELETDSDGNILTEEAKEFVNPFMSLIDNLQQHEGELSKEMEEALEELLGTLGLIGEENG